MANIDNMRFKILHIGEGTREINQHSNFNLVTSKKVRQGPWVPQSSLSMMLIFSTAILAKATSQTINSLHRQLEQKCLKMALCVRHFLFDEVLTSCTRTSLGRTLALTSTLVLIDDQENPNVQPCGPRCSRGFCADSAGGEPPHVCSCPLGSTSCWHPLHQTYAQPSAGHCNIRASLNPSLSK